MELRKKMYRDMRDNFLQFFSIFLIAALGVFAYSGLNSARVGLINSMDKYYKETIIADLWVYTENPDKKNVEKIQEIELVDEAQSRLVYTYSYDNNEIELIVPEDNSLSKPYIIEGSEYSVDGEGIWIDRDFALSNGYQVGDIITINDIDVKIEGIILSSEKIYSPPSGEVITDFDIYGYAYMSKTYFEKIFGVYFTNQIIIKANDSSEGNLKNIISEVKDILGDKYYTYVKQDDQASANHINERKRQLLQFTYIFPGLFYILALLTMLTTMKRIIDKQKIQIATMMSLGYSKLQIVWHYMSYGLWIGIIGGVVGAIIGYLVIPDILIESFRHLAMVPYWDAPFTWESILAVVVMVLVCMFAIMISCFKQVRIMPALIFHGDSIRKIKHNILEKTTLWNKISFKSQMTIRNITKNKMRTVMGIIGVLGSVVLVLAGLGMKDSFDYTVASTYNDFYKYESKVQIDDPNIKINSLGIDNGYQFIEESTVEFKNVDMSDDDKIQAMITVVDEGDFLFAPVEDGDVNLYSVEGITISTKLAEVLNVEEGDYVSWRLNGSDWKQFRIGLIVESALPRITYISVKDWEESDEEFEANAILTSTNSEKIKANTDGVKKVVSIEGQEASFQKVCDSSKSIVYIMIFAAILLVVVVLINLEIMNFTEMYRDYATLKVLGLFPGEIAMISFTENLVLTLFGWIVGIFIAYGFVDVYMQMLSNDTLVCLSKIENISVVISSAIILCCSLGVNLILSSKLRNVDMVEALKANE